MNAVFYAGLGYVSGSILFARIWGRVFRKPHMLSRSKDGNPGTANAFLYGGFWCGVLTLIGDIAKGFLPVYAYMTLAFHASPSGVEMAAVLAAPVIGHAFPLFFKGRGGKGIAVSFGCLLGLWPVWEPFAVLAASFILFSVVIRISPHFYRTIAAFAASLAVLPFFLWNPGIWMGFACVTAVVTLRLLMSREEKSELEVKPVWTH